MRAISFCIVCSWFPASKGGGVRLPGHGSSRLVDGEASVAAAPRAAAQSPSASDGITVHRPCRATRLFGPMEDVEVFIPNVPVTLPLKVPLRPNEPVCVVGPERQEPLVVCLKLAMLIDPPLC